MVGFFLGLHHILPDYPRDFGADTADVSNTLDPPALAFYPKLLWKAKNTSRK
jgi:hypothetical protein